MRQSIVRWSLAALWVAAMFACFAPVHAQFRGRESAPPADADRIPEELQKLVDAIDEETLAKPPQRDFKVEKGPAESTKLFRADPKLLENKFMARIVMTAAAMFGTNTAFDELTRVVPELPQGVKRLIDGRGRITIFTRIDPSSGNFRNFTGIDTSEAIKTLSGYFQLLSELCPKDQLPPQAAIDFLTSAEGDRDVVWEHFVHPGQSDPRRWYITVYAPSEELAEQRARAIVQLLDNGLCRPLQRDCLAEAKKSLDEARKGYDEVARLTQAIKANEEKLAKPSEINADILTQLKAQKVMVGVELAGLEARIKACNAMLRNRDAALEKVRESISDMKVRAEVELVGTKEKLDRINALVSEGNDRVTLRDQINKMYEERRELQRQIDRTHQRRAEAYARLVSLYAPLEIFDNKITISPIEWTN